MSGRLVKLLDSASEGDVGRLVDLLLDGFPEDDPTKIGLLGGKLDLKEEYFTAMVRAALLEGDVWVVEIDGQWVTIGLWFKWPNILFTTDAQKDLGFNEVFKKFSPETQHWWKVEYGEQVDVWLKQKTISEEEWGRMWYCSALATRSAHQSKGHATALVNRVLSEVHNQANGILGLGTGSETNVAKYKSMGFKERGRITMHTPVNSFLCAWLTKGT
ncbi:hypothetical protein PENSPDRAFT_654763 [Peniophora sp. CONT]|nr:hypothetical protein PENSPDRAFT_654763 [Peniophora sp. CONT]